jgi:hypothetical protein
MAVYFGVVKDNRIELEGSARLNEGARVEVRPVGPAATPPEADTAEAERALVRDLLAAGLLDEPPTDETLPEEPFEPVTVRGRPLSEQIIEERR